MSAPVFQIEFTQDIKKPVLVQHCGNVVFTGDNLSDTISVSVLEDGEPYAISGTVAMNCIRADGATVTVTGSVSGNTASATLTQACVAIPGPLAVVIKVTSDSTTTTLLKAVYMVDVGVTGTAVDPGTIIPDVTTLINAIETAVGSIPADYSDLLATIAPDFVSGTYNKDQYVWNNGTLYRFTDNHSGSWTGTDVEAVVIGDELTGLKSALSINPDSYEGTDTEKLQSALNALQDIGGDIIISRLYTLSANLISKNNSNLNRLIRFHGIGQGAIQFNQYGFKGYNNDHTGAYGGIVLDGITLLSGSSTRSTMFDGNTLIRIFIRNCVITGFASICATDNYLQTLYITDCLIRSATNPIVARTNTTIYDLHITNCVIESCKTLIIANKCNGVFICNNLIEGLTGTPIAIRDECHKFVVTANYFENNGMTVAHMDTSSSLITISVSTNTVVSLTVSDNLIHQSVNHSGNIDRLIVFPQHDIGGQVTICNNYALAGAMLVYCGTKRQFANVLYYCNVTNEKSYDQGQYDCADYVKVITAQMINSLFTA